MREQTIFTEALERDDPADRVAFLDGACDGDHVLRERIEKLLRRHQETNCFLESPVQMPPGPIGEPLADEGPGTAIGPYKLLEQIGEGGMGVVYMAEQTRPVRREVALKIIKPGMDTRQVVSRFEAERQALAMMEHPNIARVLDAGATESGRPYFVMELVRGVPITEYCDTHRLTIADRLDLIVQVCQAVQHAHQKGIIHRDLKPSNVLVTMQDDVPIPKVIDFGIAKATGQLSLTDRTLFTGFAQLVGTPLYMSPEQAELSGTDVDTRSDIYSLGVLLYELLTGTTPFDSDTLRKAAYDEVRRIIREQEPPTPSTRLITLGETRSAVASSRQTEARKLNRSLRGELDWITMKALEKDRSRRYDTAAAFADDIRRYRVNEPVEAGPPSAWYRLRKFARRNRVALLTAGFGVLVLLSTLVALVIGTTVVGRERDVARQAAEGERRMAGAAERERRRAEENFRRAQEAVDRVFTRAAEEMANKPHLERIRCELLEDALEFYKGFLAQKGDDSSVRREAARTYLRVGRIYRLLGRYKESLPPLDHARVMLEELSKQEPDVPAHREELAETHNHISYADQWLDRWDLTLEHRSQWLALREQLRREFSTVPNYLEQEAYARAAFAVSLTNVGRPREAVNQFRLALTQYEKYCSDFPDVPVDRELVAHAYHWLGDALQKTDRRGEAERAFRQSYEIRKRLVADRPGDPDARHKLSHVGAYLAKTLMESGRSGESEPLLRQAVEIDERLLADYPDNADYLRRAADDYKHLAIVLSRGGSAREAESALRRGLEVRTKMVVKVPDESVHEGLAWFHYDLGALLEAEARPEEAAEAFRQTLVELEKMMERRPESPYASYLLSWVLATCPDARFRDPERAVELAWQAVRREPKSGRYRTGLGVARYRAGDPSGAIESLALARDLLGREDAISSIFLAMAHWRLRHREQALRSYDKAVSWIETNRPIDEELERFTVEAADLIGVRVPGVNQGGDGVMPNGPDAFAR